MRPLDAISIVPDALNAAARRCTQVEDGPSDQSYGIAVASACGFPPSVIDAAKRKLAQLEGASTQGSTQGGAEVPPTVVAKRARLREIADVDRQSGLKQLKKNVLKFVELDLSKMQAEEQVSPLHLPKASTHDPRRAMPVRLCAYGHLRPCFSSAVITNSVDPHPSGNSIT